MPGLVVVCGLVAEAEIARGGQEAVAAIAGGGNAGRIIEALEHLAPDAVLSFGLAGGLAPNQRPGAAWVAGAVLDGGGRRLPVDASWTEALAERLALPVGLIQGVDAALADGTAKTAMHAATGAALVDMESHIAAGWAARRGLPFAALRVVSDPAERSLPPAATVGMRVDGTIDLRAVLLSLAKAPWQLPALIRTGLEARAAFASLLRCRQRLGPGFARLDL